VAIDDTVLFRYDEASNTFRAGRDSAYMIDEDTAQTILGMEEDFPHEYIVGQVFQIE
jgi:hypothetical protein